MWKNLIKLHIIWPIFLEIKGKINASQTKCHVKQIKFYYCEEELINKRIIDKSHEIKTTLKYKDVTYILKITLFWSFFRYYIGMIFSQS